MSQVLRKSIHLLARSFSRHIDYIMISEIHSLITLAVVHYVYSTLLEPSGLTIVGHAHREALVESAVLALVAVLLLDFTVTFTLVILKL